MSNPHKYNTPEWMIYRLTEWIGQNGGEDSMTLMVHEAKETIKKLAAQQDDDKVDVRPRSEQTIVDQTEKIAGILAGAFHGSMMLNDAKFQDSNNPKAQVCWRVACNIQEVLTDTDVENAIAELDGAEDAKPNPAMAGVSISLEEIDAAIRDAALEGLSFQSRVGIVRAVCALLKRVQPASGEDASDATRYRWIRDGMPGHDAILELVGSDLDAAIDTAIQERQP